MKNPTLFALIATLAAPLAAQAADGSPTFSLSAGAFKADPLEVLGTGLTINPRVGYFVNPSLGFELNVGIMPVGKTQVGTPDPFNYFALTPRLDMVGRLFDDKAVNPLLAVGAGAFMKSVSDDGALELPVSGMDVDFLANAGPGVMVPFGNIAFRADMRWLFNAGSENWQNHGDKFINWEYTAGLMYLQSGPKDSDDDGIIDENDGCIDQPEDMDQFEDEDGCPDTDNDGDSILDADDTCPNEAEDLDEYEDTDGCPEPDNDGDTVLDADDACPTEAGTVATKGCPDTDEDGIADSIDECVEEAGSAESFGCPDGDGDHVPDYRDDCPEEAGNEGADARRSDGCKSLAYVTADKIVITEKVQFNSGRATIKKASHELLNKIARIMKKHKGIQEIQIEGHTDSQGKDDYNQKLSQDRAEAVKAYLVEKGISADRLSAKGFGETKPVGDNETPEGREANRRVEFNITKQDVGKKLQRGVKAKTKQKDIPTKKDIKAGEEKAKEEAKPAEDTKAEDTKAEDTKAEDKPAEEKKGEE